MNCYAFAVQVRYMRDTDAAALQVFHDYGDRHLRKMQRYIVVNFGGGYKNPMFVCPCVVDVCDCHMHKKKQKIQF